MKAALDLLALKGDIEPHMESQFFESLIPLQRLIGLDSCYLFQLLNIDTSFFNEPVKEWNSCEAYLYSKKIVQRLDVVNDCGERSVKIAPDFAETAKTSSNFNSAIQVVEKNRKDQPSLRKKKRMNL